MVFQWFVDAFRMFVHGLGMIFHALGWLLEVSEGGKLSSGRPGESSEARSSIHSSNLRGVAEARELSE